MTSASDLCIAFLGKAAGLEMGNHLPSCPRQGNYAGGVRLISFYDSAKAYRLLRDTHHHPIISDHICDLSYQLELTNLDRDDLNETLSRFLAR